MYRFLIVLLLLLPSSKTAQGCACPDNSFFRLYNNADIVFVGELLGTGPGNDQVRIINLRVLEAFKGVEKGNKVQITTPVDIGCFGIDPAAAIQVLIFASLRADGFYYATTCTHSNSFVYINAFRKMLNTINNKDTAWFDTEFGVTVYGRYSNRLPKGKWLYPVGTQLSIESEYFLTGITDSIVSVVNNRDTTTEVKSTVNGRLISYKRYEGVKLKESSVVKGKKLISTVYYDGNYAVTERAAFKLGVPYTVCTFLDDGRQVSTEYFDGKGNLLKKEEPDKKSGR